MLRAVKAVPTYNKVQNFYMKSAINEAIAVAYKAAHQEYTKQYLGIYVLESKAIQVQKGSKGWRYDHRGRWQTF